jgi:polysaccharide pyruvyl transferase WcaK-like protein
MTRVLLVNWAGMNSGDDFLCEVLVHRLALLYPDWELYLLSEAYVDAVKDRIDRAHWRPFFNALRSITEFRGMCSEIRKADRILIGGGDVVRPEFLSVLPLLVAVIFRKPVALVGVGVVAPNSGIWRGLYRIAMTMVDLALVRDLGSQRALNGALSCQVKVAPDLVFGLTREREVENRTNDDRRNVVINLRTVSDRVYSRLLGASDVSDEIVCAALAHALVAFASSEPYHIILLPMVDDDASARGYPEATSDLTILRTLRDQLPSHVQVTLLSCRPRSLAELKAVYADAAIVVAMRLHAIVPALAWGVPVVAIPYASKVEALRETFNDLRSISLTNLAQGDYEGVASAMRETLSAAPDRCLSEQVGSQSRTALERIFLELPVTGPPKPRWANPIATVVSIIALAAIFIKTLCGRRPGRGKPVGKVRAS